MTRLKFSAISLLLQQLKNLLIAAGEFDVFEIQHDDCLSNSGSC
jgi:hypothetical protein